MGLVSGAARAAGTMPMDLYRPGDHYMLRVDHRHPNLPGADSGRREVKIRPSNCSATGGNSLLGGGCQAGRLARTVRAAATMCSRAGVTSS
jgi:hypothetical protein